MLCFCMYQVIMRLREQGLLPRFHASKALSCQTNGTDVLWLQGFSNFSEMTQRYNHFAYLLLLEKLVRRSATRD